MHWTMYVLPLESVYGEFAGAGQRLVPVGVVGVVEEGTTGAVVVPGGTGVVGTTDDGPADGGPTDDGPTGVDSTGDDSTGPVGPTGAVDPTGVVGTPGVVDATGEVGPTEVVGTPGVVDATGEVGPTEVSGSRGLVAGLVPVLVSTTVEPSEFVVVSAVVKVTGMVDRTGAVVIPEVVSTIVEPSEFVVVSWATKLDGSLDEIPLNKVPSRSAPQHSAMLPLQDVQLSPSGSAASCIALVPQLHVSPRSHQYQPLRMG